MPENKIVFRSNSPRVLKQAILFGMGIGFLFEHEARACSELRAVFPPRKEWDVVNWLVTHGDLHRTAKVQAFLNILKKSGRLL